MAKPITETECCEPENADIQAFHSLWSTCRHTYESHREQWVAKHLGQYVAIGADAFAEPRVGLVSAIEEGRRIFKDGRFCIVCIGEDQQEGDLPSTVAQ